MLQTLYARRVSDALRVITGGFRRCRRAAAWCFLPLGWFGWWFNVRGWLLRGRGNPGDPVEVVGGVGGEARQAKGISGEGVVGGLWEGLPPHMNPCRIAAI